MFNFNFPGRGNRALSFSVKLQAIFRGFLLRKKLKQIQSTVRYVDDEIDLLEKNEFCNEFAIELDDKWLSYNGTPDHQIKFSMAYGDHIRHRSTTEVRKDISGKTMEPRRYKNQIEGTQNTDNIEAQDVNRHIFKDTRQRSLGGTFPNKHNTDNSICIKRDETIKASGFRMRRRQKRTKCLPAWMYISEEDNTKDWQKGDS